MYHIYLTSMSKSNHLATSTDAKEFADVLEMDCPHLLTFSRKSLKDNLSPKVSHIIVVLDSARNNSIIRSSSIAAATVPTILNESGQIDINKFTDTIIQLKKLE